MGAVAEPGSNLHPFLLLSMVSDEQAMPPFQLEKLGLRVLHAMPSSTITLMPFFRDLCCLEFLNEVSQAVQAL